MNESLHISDSDNETIKSVISSSKTSDTPHYSVKKVGKNKYEMVPSTDRSINLEDVEVDQVQHPSVSVTSTSTTTTTTLSNICDISVNTRIESDNSADSTTVTDDTSVGIHTISQGETLTKQLVVDSKTIEDETIPMMMNQGSNESIGENSMYPLSNKQHRDEPDMTIETSNVTNIITPAIRTVETNKCSTESVRTSNSANTFTTVNILSTRSNNITDSR